MQLCSCENYLPYIAIYKSQFFNCKCKFNCLKRFITWFKSFKNDFLLLCSKDFTSCEHFWSSGTILYIWFQSWQTEIGEGNDTLFSLELRNTKNYNHSATHSKRSAQWFLLLTSAFVICIESYFKMSQYYWEIQNKVWVYFLSRTYI